MGRRCIKPGLQAEHGETQRQQQPAPALSIQAQLQQLTAMARQGGQQEATAGEGDPQTGTAGQGRPGQALQLTPQLRQRSSMS